jgi:hypothetical protein
MNRRELFRNFLLIYTGASLIPSCVQNEKKSALVLKNLHINDDQEATLESLAETIIPQTDSPGGKALQSHLYVLMMVDECKSAKDQEVYLKGLDQFMTLAKEKIGNGFVQSGPAEKAKFLQEIEKKNNIPDELAGFYATTKRLTIQSFTTSEYFLTKIQVYDMVPGRWHGCFPVKNINQNG